MASQTYTLVSSISHQTLPSQASGPVPVEGGRVLRMTRDIMRKLSIRYRRKTGRKGDRGRPHSFVNSQEWTLARSVPDIKLGILGSIHSGKSALVHRYLTGSYMQEESPEGGRFKKEVVIEGQSYLLLIRDEGGAPEMQFTHWVDAVICVFSLENEMSFSTIYSYYAKMAHHRNTSEVPLILVGTQDSISESNPRVIDDSRVRKLASDLKTFSYYETCATYGLNVERVFQDACQKISQMKMSSLTPNNSRPSTPNHSMARGYYTAAPPTAKNCDAHSSSSQSTSGSGNLPTATPSNSSHSIQGQTSSASFKEPQPGHTKEKDHKKHRERPPPQLPIMAPPMDQMMVIPHVPPDKPPDEPERYDYWDYSTPGSTPRPSRRMTKVSSVVKSNSFSGPSDRRELTTPNSTPIFARKNKNKSNLISERLFGENVERRHNPKGSSVFQRRSRDSTSSLSEDRMESLMKDFHVSSSNSPLTPLLTRMTRVRSSLVLDKPDSKDLPTPSSTPTQSRKNRRRSNLFTQKKGAEEEKKQENGKLGSGRVIPLKQGYLYKKSSKGLNKEWKKKYVTLCDNGKLTYHSSLHDYMDDVHGKEIQLQKTTVKVPGAMRSRVAPKTVPTLPHPDPPSSEPIHDGLNSLSLAGKGKGDKENVLLTAYDVLREGQRGGGGDDAVVIPNASLTPGNMFSNGALESALANLGVNTANSKIDTPNVKKRHRRAKSGNNKVNANDGDDSDGYEFVIVSLENKQWLFEAQSNEERDEWVQAIEQQILFSLQCNESNKSKSKNNTMTDPSGVMAIRNTRGNSFCADCEAPSPDWTSLNLGAVVCIECSGIHRNLGTHLSRVRSLDLDEWPPDLVAIMTAVGNEVANSVWEGNTKSRPKPQATSPRDEKERWIRAKYEALEFLPPPPSMEHPIHQHLIDAIVHGNIRDVILCLAHAKPEDVNTPFSRTDSRTALHIAAALGSVVFVQLLLWYNANVKIVDHEGRNALWYARNAGSQECVELLKSNGCPEHPTLPRRRGSSTAKPSQQPPPPPPQQNNNDVFEKLPASVI